MCGRGSWDLEGGGKALPQLQERLNGSPVISSSDPLYVSNGAGEMISSCCSSVSDQRNKHHGVK